MYLAPMEGITGYIYRNAVNEYFPYQDKYFTPFIATNHNKIFTTRELRDILPENNEPDMVVPQILSNNADDFTMVANALKEYGYNEINLNLGCPSPTVVTKNKGAGLLKCTKQLEEFLDGVFEKADKESLNISIKTRIGFQSPDEFVAILDIYNRYPVYELIIHPRVQKDLYKNSPNWDIFRYALSVSKAPVCYNGDIFTKADYDRFKSAFPDVTRIMCGRGILVNPALAGEITAGVRLDKSTFRSFHDSIYQGYCEIIPDERNVLFKMKELWHYMIQSFDKGDRYFKEIRKAQRKCDYESAVNGLFSNQQIKS